VLPLHSPRSERSEAVGPVFYAGTFARHGPRRVRVMNFGVPALDRPSSTIGMANFIGHHFEIEL
jgi:hypothetical protein